MMTAETQRRVVNGGGAGAPAGPLPSQHAGPGRDDTTAADDGHARRRKRGRPKGSKNAADTVMVERPRCLACGSLARSRYWGYDVKTCAGTDSQGQGYSYIRRRRCRCLACRRVRIEKEYLRSATECAQRE